MDKFEKATSLVRKYYEYEDSKNISDLITEVCAYFDLVKDDDLTQGQIKFLLSYANIVGIPQYMDMLFENFQNSEFILHDLDLMSLGALLHEKSLHVSETKKLHRYQKEVLDNFKRKTSNRFVLSAPTSFGKTHLVYEIIKKMGYSNIVLIFPTISLLSENFDRLVSKDVDNFFDLYEFHTLSDDDKIGVKNIWLFTPERFLSYIDKNSSRNFDFIFIDEIYKIDNEYLIDNETTGENERDIAYRIALEFACRKSNDILLAGPYMEIAINPNFNQIAEKMYSSKHKSFENFTIDRNFNVLDYNQYEIVNKAVLVIKSKKEYLFDGMTIPCGQIGVYQKVFNTVNTLVSHGENTIIYNNFKARTETYASELLKILKDQSFRQPSVNSILDSFISHLERNFGYEWILVKALKKGIAIHHGLIPKYIQKEIIKQFNEGALPVLISTTTITEGVNTSAKNIIITSNKKGNKPLKHFDAKNIAGRAGRFLQHYVGRIIIIDKDFKETLDGQEDILSHKNFDFESPKNDIDYPITDEKYLSKDDIKEKEELNSKIGECGITQEIIDQFKVISPRDKLFVYDRISSMTNHEHADINQLVNKLHRQKMMIDWDGFQLIIDILKPIIKNQKLSSMIEYKCKNDSPYSIITAKLHYYLKNGFSGLLEYTLNTKKRDAAIRDTADLIYNIFKYQLVKYLGVFDILYRFYKSKINESEFEEEVCITTLLKKLEYNAFSENGRVLNDFGVPFRLVEYYDKEIGSVSKKKFDTYEAYIDSEIQHLLK